jgi:hypothetical protein
VQVPRGSFGIFVTGTYVRLEAADRDDRSKKVAMALLASNDRIRTHALKASQGVPRRHQPNPIEREHSS